MRVALWSLAVGCAPAVEKGSGPEVADADGDGYTAWVDCDDAHADIFPDAPDTWYDGVDTNCDGADDYDQDGDGHRAIAWGGDDCDDVDPMVSPAVGETPYDGIDNDCSPATADDDLDADGHPGAVDCDDLDPAVHRGALEILGDAVDTDCDGNPDGSRFGFSDLQWVAPSAPRLAVAGGRVALVLTAAQVSSPTWLLAAADQVGVIVPLDPSGAGGVAPMSTPTIWVTASDALGAPDVQADGDQVWVGASWADTGEGWLGLSRLGWTAGGWQPQEAVALPGTDPGLAVDLAVDEGGEPWLCAAGPATVAYLRGDGESSSHQVAADGTGGCASEGPRFTTVAADGLPTTWDADPDAADPAPVPAAEQPFAAERWGAVREADGVVTAVDRDGGVVVVEGDTVRRMLPGLAASDAQAVVAGDETWIVAVADRGQGPELVLAWDVAGVEGETWLPVQVPGHAAALEPTGAALALAPGRVAVAVTGRDGRGGAAVGWCLLGRS